MAFVFMEGGRGVEVDEDAPKKEERVPTKDELVDLYCFVKLYFDLTWVARYGKSGRCGVCPFEADCRKNYGDRCNMKVLASRIEQLVEQRFGIGSHALYDELNRRKADGGKTVPDLSHDFIQSVARSLDRMGCWGCSWFYPSPTSSGAVRKSCYSMEALLALENILLEEGWKE